jgi:hypothetical protein
MLSSWGSSYGSNPPKGLGIALVPDQEAPTPWTDPWSPHWTETGVRFLLVLVPCFSGQNQVKGELRCEYQGHLICSKVTVMKTPSVWQLVYLLLAV